MEFDIVVVGGGVIGATVCALLASNAATQNLRIAIVDASDPPATYRGADFDPRVFALSKQSEQILHAAGIWNTVLAERACAYYRMDVWDAEGTGAIQFNCEELHQPRLGTIVENSVLLRSLHPALKQRTSLHFFSGYHVKQHAHNKHNELRIARSDDTEAQTLFAPLLLAADGAHSKIRQLAKVKTREWAYGQTAIVTTVHTEALHEHSCRQRFTSDGPVAFLPLQQGPEEVVGDQHYSSLVWSAEDQLASKLMTMDDTQFCTALAQAFEHRLGNVESCAERFALPLRQRHAVDYFQPGIALVGDAAHTLHPLAGQGANLGLYDARALADEIIRACERGVPLDDGSILRRYQRQRKTHNLAAMAAMEGFKRLFAADQLPLRWARNTGMTFANNQLFLKRQLAKIAAG